MKTFDGKVLFLDKDDINTDEIIPAKYLTEIKKEALKPYLLEDLKLDRFDPTKDIKGKSVIITKENFGCGSSREHAPWALEVNGIYVVIAKSFARIFRQNMFNNGILAISLDGNVIDDLFTKFANKDISITVELDDQKMFIMENNTTIEEIQINLSGFDVALVKAGGWVEYADANY